MKYFALIAIFLVTSSEVANAASSTSLAQYAFCAAKAPVDLAPAANASAVGYAYATSQMAVSSMQLFFSMSYNITVVAASPGIINTELNSINIWFLVSNADIMIAQYDTMIAVLNATVNTCSSVNQTAVTSIQPNITMVIQQITQIKQAIKSAYYSLYINVALSDNTVMMMTQSQQSYVQIMNFLVISIEQAIYQKPLMLLFFEYIISFSQSSMNAALAGMVAFYNAAVIIYMTSLNATIAIANSSCNSMNTTTQSQINLTIIQMNATMNESGTFLPAFEQADIYNYTNLTIVAMTQIEVDLIINITYAAGNMTSFFGINITAAMQNITQMGQNATINITQTMNTTTNRVWAVFCATTSFQQIQLVVQNASNYLGQCVTDAVKDMKNDTDTCAQEFKNKSNNATNSVNNCTKPGTHEKTDDEFKQCLEDGSDSGSKDLKQKCEEKSHKMEKGGDNEKKCKKCKEGKEDDAYYAFQAIVIQFKQCVAIFG